MAFAETGLRLLNALTRFTSNTGFFQAQQKLVHASLVTGICNPNMPFLSRPDMY